MSEHIEYQSKVPIRLRAVKWDGSALALEEMRKMCDNVAEFKVDDKGNLSFKEVWHIWLPVTMGYYLTRTQGGLVSLRHPFSFEAEYEKAREGSWL
jgi:hypothetical protein